MNIFLSIMSTTFIIMNKFIALPAFLLSLYSIWRQREKEAKESLKERCANVSANFIKMGDGKRILKIFNKGNSLAKNVNIQFPDGEPDIGILDLYKKLPINLEEHQSVDFLTLCHMNSPSKIKIILTWDDNNKLANEKETHITL